MGVEGKKHAAGPENHEHGSPGAVDEAFEHTSSVSVSSPTAPRSPATAGVHRTPGFLRACPAAPLLRGFMRKAIPWMLSALALFVALLVAVTAFVDEPLRRRMERDLNASLKG